MVEQSEIQLRLLPGLRRLLPNVVFRENFSGDDFGMSRIELGA